MRLSRGGGRAPLRPAILVASAEPWSGRRGSLRGRMRLSRGGGRAPLRPAIQVASAEPLERAKGFATPGDRGVLRRGSRSPSSAFVEGFAVGAGEGVRSGGGCVCLAGEAALPFARQSWWRVRSLGAGEGVRDPRRPRRAAAGIAFPFVSFRRGLRRWSGRRGSLRGRMRLSRGRGRAPLRPAILVASAEPWSGRRGSRPQATEACCGGDRVPLRQLSSRASPLERAKGFAPRADASVSRGRPRSPSPGNPGGECGALERAKGFATPGDRGVLRRGSRSPSSAFVEGFAVGAGEGVRSAGGCVCLAGEAALPFARQSWWRVRSLGAGEGVRDPRRPRRAAAGIAFPFVS